MLTLRRELGLGTHERRENKQKYSTVQKTANCNWKEPGSPLGRQVSILGMEIPQKQQQPQHSKNDQNQRTAQSGEFKIVSCPVCNNEMTFIQTCHLRCMVCGAELSCEDKGWFWG